MQKILPYIIDFRSCLFFAKKLLDEKNYEEAFTNLKEAKLYVKTEAERDELYDAILEFYSETKNFHAIVQTCINHIIEGKQEDCFIFENFNEFIFGDTVENNDGDDGPSFNIPDTLQISQFQWFNRAKNALRSGKRLQFSQMCDEMPDDFPYYDAILDELHLAVMNDPSIGSDGNIFRQACRFYRDNPENINAISTVMSFENRNAVEQVSSRVNDQIAYYENYYFGLIELAVVYMRVKAYETAEKVLNAALRSKPMEETGLWYYAKNAFLMGNETEGNARFKKYKLICEDTGVPFDFYEAYFHSQNIGYSIYPNVSYEYRKSVYDKLMAFTDKNMELDEAFLRQLEGLLIVESNRAAKNILIVLNMDMSPEVVNLLKRLLINHRVTDFVKTLTVTLFIEHGYEGEFAIATEKRIICTNLLRFRARGISSKFKEIYNGVLSYLLIYGESVPINCTVLSKVIKERAKELNGQMDDASCDFEKLCVLSQYLIKIEANFNLSLYLDYLEISFGEFMKYRDKYVH